MIVIFVEVLRGRKNLEAMVFGRVKDFPVGGST
jgi:hypothetical protein